MKALLLIGGQATRLLPLSKYVAKSLLPICDRELLHYQLSALALAGIGEIVLAAGYQVEQLRAYAANYRGLRIAISQEPEPRGTAGAIAEAAELLAGDACVVLNADILSDLDIGAVVAAHQAAGRAATIVGHQVADPSRYGLLRTQGDAIIGFTEKPDGVAAATADGTGGPSYYINAGIYVLEPQVIASIPRGRAVSIEREVFPQLTQRGALTLFPHEGLWTDVGTFESYFAANFALLAQRYVRGETTLWGVRSDCAVFKDLVYLHNSAKLASQVNLYHRAIVMAGCVLGEACRVENSILMPGASLGANCDLGSCIVGPGVALPDGLAAQNRLFIAGEESAAFYPINS